MVSFAFSSSSPSALPISTCKICQWNFKVHCLILFPNWVQFICEFLKYMFWIEHGLNIYMGNSWFRYILSWLCLSSLHVRYPELPVHYLFNLHSLLSIKLINPTAFCSINNYGAIKKVKYTNLTNLLFIAVLYLKAGENILRRIVPLIMCF